MPSLEGFLVQGAVFIGNNAHAVSAIPQSAGILQMPFLTAAPRSVRVEKADCFIFYSRAALFFSYNFAYLKNIACAEFALIMSPYQPSRKPAFTT